MPMPIPQHLRIYLGHQDYAAYTPEDQAVWRYTMRQLKDFLAVNAHESYLDGLVKTGITAEQIPKIPDIDRKLRKFGWGAVPVSGFIPPAAFMELQSLGYLPIAAEMRSVEHILYTPAPDIVHEAAGHAPILVNREFANYLKRYAEVSAKSIISKEDIDIYEAIRVLSDAKERPGVSNKRLQKLEKDLDKKTKRISFVSEAGLLGRMNWWTAEYGLVGNLRRPRLFGAGLLSSIGESRNCLKPSVKKLPLTLKCLDYSYDITEQQPQLFVSPNFKHLSKVLDQLASNLAYKKGGTFALKRVHQARTVNTVELDSGLQISGKLEEFKESNGKVVFLRFSGPTQLCFHNKELSGQDKDYHIHGYSTPVGSLTGHKKPLAKMSLGELKRLGALKFQSGIQLAGEPTQVWRSKGKNLIIRFKDCKVTYKNKVLFDPAWGDFDLAIGGSVRTAFGGPADRNAYGLTDAFPSVKIPRKHHSASQKKLFQMYTEVRKLRERLLKRKGKAKTALQKQLNQLYRQYIKSPSAGWLIAMELLEISRHLKASTIEFDLEKRLRKNAMKPRLRNLIQDGLRLSKKLVL